MKELSTALAEVEPDDLGDDVYDEAAMDAAGVYPGRWVRSAETFDPLGTMCELYSYVQDFMARQARAGKGVAITMTVEPAPDDDDEEAIDGEPAEPVKKAPVPASRGAVVLSGANGRTYDRIEGKPQKALDESFARLGVSTAWRPRRPARARWVGRIRRRPRPLDEKPDRRPRGPA